MKVVGGIKGSALDERDARSKYSYLDLFGLARPSGLCYGVTPAKVGHNETLTLMGFSLPTGKKARVLRAELSLAMGFYGHLHQPSLFVARGHARVTQ